MVNRSVTEVVDISKWEKRKEKLLSQMVLAQFLIINLSDISRLHRHFMPMPDKVWMYGMQRLGHAGA